MSATITMPLPRPMSGRRHWKTPPGGLTLPGQGNCILPKPIDACDLLASNLPIPPELVCGILHKGSKMLIGGGSKSFKTWTLIDLAVSVATGTKWWGFDTNQSRVLFMNLEIQDYFFSRRLGEVEGAKGCQLTKGQLSYWGLRGKATDLRTLM